MTATSYMRGYPVYWDESEKKWRYKDNDQIADFNSVRPCMQCGRVFEGSNEGKADPCLGELPGVDNACCGHGVRSQAYIRFTNGVIIRGFDRIEKA